MSGLPWFRMYVDFLNDPKMIAIAFEDQRHFIGILALKSDGVLDQDCDEKIMDRIVAQRLWLDYSSINDVKKRLVDAQLIDDLWQPIAWEKRQCRSDHDPTGAERQRKFRAKKKAEISSNALHNADSNASVTPPEEIRRDKIREEERRVDKIRENKKPSSIQNQTLPADIDTELWTEFMKSRKRLKASSSDVAIKILLTTLDKCVAAGFTRNEAISEAIERGWKSVKPEWLKNSVKSNQSFSEQKNERRKAAGEEWLNGGHVINSTCETVQ